MKLLLSAFLKIFIGFLLILLLIFLPAGTIRFFQGWLFLFFLFIPMIISGIIMYLKAPALLKKRLSAKESRKEQSLIVKLSGLMFIVGFVVSGLDHRFAIFPIPLSVSYIAGIIFVVFYIMYFEVLRENAFLSRTIEVQQNQTVVETGLYAIIRHPMYTATVFMFLSIPLILGSLIALVFFLFYPLLIVLRIKNEEALLIAELNGYAEYTKKVRYKLIPFIY